MTGQWFSQGTPVSSTNKTDHHDITEILLKVVLNTISQTEPNFHGFTNLIYWHTLSLVVSIIVEKYLWHFNPLVKAFYRYINLKKKIFP